MPPHLHPRSRLTTTLFTGTLAVSFLVVGMPHLLPCPVPQRAFADSPNYDPSDPSQSRRKRRRRKSAEDQSLDGSSPGEDEASMARGGRDRHRRECPVPKPSGLVGQILGFSPNSNKEEVKLPTVVRIEKFSERRSGRRNDDVDDR